MHFQLLHMFQQDHILQINKLVSKSEIRPTSFSLFQESHSQSKKNMVQRNINLLALVHKVRILSSQSQHFKHFLSDCKRYLFFYSMSRMKLVA